MLVTERNFSSTMEFLSKQPRLVVDTETNGLNTWSGARIIGISVAPPKAPRNRCYYFPFRHKPGGNLGPQRLRQLIKLQSKKLKTGWGIAHFDVAMLMADGMDEPDYVEDVMLLFHLMDENQWKTGGSYELKIFAERYINKHARKAQIALTNLLADRGLGKGDMQELKPEEVEEYASDDVYYTERGREMLLPAAQEWELEQIWREVNEYGLVTRRFEEKGMLLDVPLIKAYIRECEKHRARLNKIISRMAGWEANPNSHQQMRRWLELPSTAKDYVDQIDWSLMGKQGKGIKVLQEYRQWDRAMGSYYKPFLKNMDSEHVFHPNILLHGTISGRPSARGTPNIFAIPRYTEVYKVKDVVVARPGYTLVNVDYAQAELRLGAHYSKDEFNIKCFNEGKSPHKLLLADLLEQGIKMEYDPVKRVSFGIMYGTGYPTLSKELKCDERFAKKVLKAAHALHPNYRPMLKQTERVARQFGFIRLWTGRVRRFNTLPDPQPWFHKACSNLIQGGIGEVMRVAICRLAGSLKDWDAHMLLQVYDSILFEVRTSELKQVVKIIDRDMTRDYPFSVPMVVEVKAGKRWGQLKEIKV